MSTVAKPVFKLPKAAPKKAVAVAPVAEVEKKTTKATSEKPAKVVKRKVVAEASDKSKDDAKEENVGDTVLVLKDLNLTQLDRAILPDIARKQRKDQGEDDIHVLTTSLEKLGISSSEAKPEEVICMGDRYKIKLFLGDSQRATLGDDVTELSVEKPLRCTWCHQMPPPGALTLGVPLRYVASFIHEHVYAPECVNIVKGMRVEPGKMILTEKTRKTDPKSVPKANYFKRDLAPEELGKYAEDDPRVERRNFFEVLKPVCSFPCMRSKGRELKKTDARFRNVEMLINQLYLAIFDILPVTREEAPPCDVLVEYGGSITLEKYRENFKFVRMDDASQCYMLARALIQPGSSIFTTSHHE
jgi:hypothetical protein